MEALWALKIKKVGVVTPYIEELNGKEAEFLEANGFEVVEIKGLGLLDNIDIGKQESSVSYRMVKGLAEKGCDGYSISCTNFRSIEVRKSVV